MKLSYWPASGLLLAGGGLLAGLGLLISPRLLGGHPAVGMLTPLSLASGVAGGLLILMALAGIVLVPRGREAARRNYGSHATVVGLTVLAAVGSLAVTLPALLPAPGSHNPSVIGFVLSALVLDVVLVLVVYYRVVRPGLITWRDMGLSRSKLPASWQAGLPAAGILFVLVVTIELLLRGVGVQQTQLDSLAWLRGVPPWQFGLVAATAAVLAPVAEEIYFRGYVFRAYREQKGPLQAYLFSSGLFAVVHFNLPALLPIFAVGLFLAYLYHRTGSILPGMIAHAFNNAVAFAFLYFAAT